MSDFSTEGFLSTLAEPHGLAEVRRLFAGELRLLEDVNRAVMAAQWAVEVPCDGQRGREAAAAALFSRFISNAQAAAVLGQRGMDRQMMAMVRITLESLFLLRAVVRSREFFGRYASAQSVGKLRIAQGLQRLGAAAAVDKAEVDALVASLKATVAAAGATKIEVWEVADAAGMLDWYRSLYSLASTPVHTGAHDLEHHLVLDEDGELTELVNEPCWDQVGFTLLTLTEMMIEALAAATEMFDLHRAEDLDSWRRTHRALMEQRQGRAG
jgi:hypothetical protein